MIETNGHGWDGRQLSAEDRGWLGPAAEVIRELGFSIVTGADRANPMATELVVAVREEPTLRHFDPEVVDYWAPEDQRSRPRQIDRDSQLPLAGRFEWGRISIADRLGLTNQWLSFGGIVRAAELDADTTVILFQSPAPIQRWSGHSQGLDPLTPEMGAFFGRLMIPIDFVPGAEGRILSTDPLALYCAFVADAETRASRSRALGQADRPFVTQIGREARRLRTSARDAWGAGVELLKTLEIAG